MERTCKSDSAIEDFMQRKSILYFDNEIQYKHWNDHSAGEHIDKFAKNNWLDIVLSESTIEQPKYITVIDIEYSTQRIGLNFDKTTQRVFKIMSQPIRLYQFKSNVISALTFELDTTKYEMIRNEFSFV